MCVCTLNVYVYMLRVHFPKQRGEKWSGHATAISFPAVNESVTQCV